MEDIDCTAHSGIRDRRRIPVVHGDVVAFRMIEHFFEGFDVADVLPAGHIFVEIVIIVEHAFHICDILGFLFPSVA